MNRALREELATIVGAVDAVEAPPAAAIDGVSPRVLVRPADVDQVSRILALAHAEGLAVLPRGRGTALGLGNPPARADVLVDLTRLQRVLEYEPADVTVSVEAGLGLDELDGVLDKQGQMLALDPPGWRRRTVGGVLATNASGPLRHRYGTPRDVLLGVRFVQADGSVTWGGSRVVKSVTGYDVPKLLVGSLGTLGLIVEATLRLHPRPEAQSSWLVRFDAVAAAQSFVAAVVDSPLQPACLEVLDQGMLAALGEIRAPVGVAASFASVAEAVEAQGRELADLAGRAGGHVRSAPEGFWPSFDAAWSGPTLADVVLRLACLPARVVDTVALVASLASEVGLDVRASGSAGLGSVRVRFEGEREPEVWRRSIVDPLRNRLSAQGGSAIIEQCPLGLKEVLDVWGPVDPASQALVTRIKSEFDPTRVLNPGRFVGRL